MIVPKVGTVVFCIVRVLLAVRSIVPFREKEDGIVKLIAVDPSPRSTEENFPETTQFPPIVGDGLFLILKTWLESVKFDGCVPEPSILVPHVLRSSRCPDDFE